MKIDVLTLFPDIFPGPLGSSVDGRALRSGVVEFNAVNVRDFAKDERGTVDERPYGGGPGMLMNPVVLTEAVESVKTPRSTVVLTSPRGEVLCHELAAELAQVEHLIIIAGHYEGVDERVIEEVVDREISIGDYVLSNGNLAAMVIADSVIRLLPGALGDMASAEQDSFGDGLLEFPQYTRPPVFRNRAVPEILMSGDHGRIAEYRRRMSERLTRERRPDLWEKFLINEGLK